MSGLTCQVCGEPLPAGQKPNKEWSYTPAGWRHHDYTAHARINGGLPGEVTKPPDLVDCPACNGQGTIYPGAKVGHWAGLMAWPAEVIGERCDLCNGAGEVDQATAAEYEAAELEALGE